MAKKKEQRKVIPFPTKKKKHDSCEACKKELVDETIWWAKDGKQYCDHCYENVFYPEYYGFTRTDRTEFEKEKAAKDTKNAILMWEHQKPPTKLLH